MMINNRSLCATGHRWPGSVKIWFTLTRASFWDGCGRDGFLAVTAGVCCLPRDRSRDRRNPSVRLPRIAATKARDLRVTHGKPRTSVPAVLRSGRPRAPSHFSHVRVKARSRPRRFLDLVHRFHPQPASAVASAKGEHNHLYRKRAVQNIGREKAQEAPNLLRFLCIFVAALVAHHKPPVVRRVRRVRRMSASPPTTIKARENLLEKWCMEQETQRKSGLAGGDGKRRG